MPFVVAGCEDGPNQTYSPAPPNAGNIWNGSPGAGGLADGGAYVPGATEGYDASFGGTTANDLCTPAQEKAIWTQLFTEPIVPPGLTAGIDIAGGPTGNGSSGYQGTGKPFTYDPTKETWTGCTVEQAQAILCQSVATQTFGGVTNQVGWGESQEVNAIYNTSSRQIQDLVLTYGYQGTLTGTDSKGTTYTVSLNNTPMTMTPKGGQPTQLLLDWTDSATLNPIVNGLYEALRYTYIPTFPPDTDCVAAGHCIIDNNLGNDGIFFFPAMNLAVFVATTIGSVQADSIPIIVQLGLLKLLPFSIAGNLMKLDSAGEGPTSITPNIQGTALNASGQPGPGATTCKYVLGMKYSDFDSQCVQVFTATTNPTDFQAQNLIAENKLLGADAHGDEAFSFNIQGVDPQFAAASLPATQVVADTMQPQANDVAYQLTLDQFILGKIANDYTNNDVTQIKDLHGLGMVTLEWANLVQHYMQKAYGVTTELGDPNCLNGNFLSLTGAKGAAGVGLCSGIEGVVTTAPPTLVTLPQQSANALGIAAFQQIAAASVLGQGLQPATWYSLFCSDANGLKGPVVQGYTPANCIGGTLGFQGSASYYFDTMQDAVLASGNFGTTLSELPTRDLGSRRFFFQQWILAVIKYLQSADNPTATLAQIDANPVDPNELFFDSNGGGFESGEYVFRNTVNSAKQPPTDLQITTNLTTSVINDFQFGRYNFRGEKTLYTALTTTAGDLPGAENLYLTNIVGSPLLVATYGTYACAINLDKTNAACGATSTVPAVTGPAAPPGTSCPAAEVFNGQCPLLDGYEPAFEQSVLSIAALGASPTASAMTLDTQGANGTYPFIQSAMWTLPILSNPYVQSSTQTGTVSGLIPYLPAGSGVGFPVTIDGSRDKFYNTDQLAFTGETVDGTLDFESVPFNTADGGVQNGYVIRAIESQNYLGLAFACAEPNPTTKGVTDLLAVRMYGNANDLLTYVSTHPSATADCAIQIKYSPYGNYADYISSLQYGVRFGLNAGFGGSVVSDLTLFDPNVVATLGQ